MWPQGSLWPPLLKLKWTLRTGQNRATRFMGAHLRSSDVKPSGHANVFIIYHFRAADQSKDMQGSQMISLCSGGHCKKYMGYKLTNKNQPSARHTKSQQFIQHLSCLNLQRFLNLPKHCAQVASPCFWTQFKREMANDGNAKRVVELQLPRRLDIQYLHPP